MSEYSFPPSERSVLRYLEPAPGQRSLLRPLIRVQSPIDCDAQPAKSNFQTHFS